MVELHSEQYFQIITIICIIAEERIIRKEYSRSLFLEKLT